MISSAAPNQNDIALAGNNQCSIERQESLLREIKISEPPMHRDRVPILYLLSLQELIASPALHIQANRERDILSCTFHQGIRQNHKSFQQLEQGSQKFLA